MVIGLCTVICGGEGVDAMDLIGNTRKTYFESFLELSNGITSADTSADCLDSSILKDCQSVWSPGLL